MNFNKEFESDEDELIGMRQALPVGPIPKGFDLNIPPANGEEYILHVLHEAKGLGTVFTAKGIDDSIRNICGDPLPEKSIIQPSTHGPSIAWQHDQVNKFSNLRHKVLKFRLERKPEKPENIEWPPGKEWINFVEKHKPHLSIMLAMRQGQLEEALNKLSQLPLTTSQGAWVYAIAANLDHPLSREACADLRDIARKCAVMRDSAKDEETISMMNLLITIVVEYFQQRDLVNAT